MSFIEDFLGESKKQSNRGRCLHYLSGTRCNEIISAHSIQNKGQLNRIAENGHVYRLSADLSILKKTGGLPGLKKIGVKQASAFSGFCKYHDNAVFEPIDNHQLTENKMQIALYAYRCVCRELFVKENAVAVMEKMKSFPSLSVQQLSMLNASHIGHCIGLAGLNFHKRIYDQALLAEDYESFDYTYFTSSDACNVQLSGLLYPDYDFEGNFLQDLTEEFRALDLITFFTAPIPDGWAFCFAWHASSRKTCIPFLRSLAAIVRSGENLEDALLRFTFSCCENHAIRISWWDQLREEFKQEAIKKMHPAASYPAPVCPSYLKYGCEGIASWEFNEVRTSI